MELHVARQPIFDASKTVIAYELLHRDSRLVNEYAAQDADQATSSVLTSSFLTLGLDTLTEGKMAYVNFTQYLLTQGIPTLLPQEQLGIELSPEILYHEDALQAACQLKAAGYTIALDGFTKEHIGCAAMGLADIIKINVQCVSTEEQIALLDIKGAGKIRYLAKNVECDAAFDAARRMGYALYQGYFFAHPVIYTANTIPVSRLGYIQLIRAVNEERPDFQNIVVAIENDVAMSLETVKLVNSAYFARRYKIHSVKQAIVTLGIEGVRKWVALSTLTKLGKNKPDVLVSSSLIRSKFLELVAKAMGQSNRAPEFYMLGLFSLLDALTGCPFEQILSSLNISDEVKAVLTQGEKFSALANAYGLMLSYERGRWPEAGNFAQSLNLSMSTVADIYISALRWYNDNIWLMQALEN